MLPEAYVKGDPKVRVTGATHDSRDVKPSDLFAVLGGAQTHGRLFVEAAIRAGAAALLVEEEMAVDHPQIVVPSTREALGTVAAECYGNPTQQLDLIGITGTNGKTTVTYMVEAGLTAAGFYPGVMGTVEYRFGSRRMVAKNTTPEAPVVQSLARDMVDGGVTHMILEASSHGLVLGRLDGCLFRVAAFTNLTQDHLDFHKDMDDYAEAKMQLFTSAIQGAPEAKIVVNLDDPFGAKILERASHPVMTVSVDPAADAQVRPSAAPHFTIDGVDARISTPGGEVILRSPLLGVHNLSNMLVGLGVCLQLGVDPQRACDGIASLSVVPGRLERVQGIDDIAVLVDYAHTPDALGRVLATLKPISTGRLICIFGCGGDRDPGKRPLMGKAVAEVADLAIVTSDNPRTEEPGDIIEMILPGIRQTAMPQLTLDQLPKGPNGYAVELDRRSAIRAGISVARPGDVVLIAGKGHEDYQILGQEKIHFDDREEALAAFREQTGAADG